MPLRYRCRAHSPPAAWNPFFREFSASLAPLLKMSLIRSIRPLPCPDPDPLPWPPGPPGRYDVIMSRGNNLDVTADWIDYEAAGATGPEDLAERMREAVVMVDLEHDILAFGLNRRIAEMWVWLDRYLSK